LKPFGLYNENGSSAIFGNLVMDMAQGSPIFDAELTSARAQPSQRKTALPMQIRVCHPSHLARTATNKSGPRPVSINRCRLHHKPTACISSAVHKRTQPHCLPSKHNAVHELHVHESQLIRRGSNSIVGAIKSLSSSVVTFSVPAPFDEMWVCFDKAATIGEHRPRPVG
jgi:hypothetical protein